jgi:hypothetical protein
VGWSSPYFRFCANSIRHFWRLCITVGYASFLYC